MDPPLLSLIIPTRNRPETALCCVQMALSVASSDIQVVVRDCSDTSKLADKLSHVHDERLVYERGTPTSMTDNWNKAFDLCSGKYVCFIGDDDALLTRAIEFLRSLGSREPDCIVYPRRVKYYWPDFPDLHLAAKVRINTDLTSQRKTLSSRQSFAQLLRGKRSGPLPAVYHGFVLRRTLEHLKKRNGYLFDSQGPDTFVTACLCCLDANTLYVGEPLTVDGKSGLSNSGRDVSRKTDLHFKEFPNYKIDPSLPQISSPSVIVADSYVKALKKMDNEFLLEAFHTKYLGAVFADLMVHNPRKFAEVWKSYLSALSSTSRVSQVSLVLGSLLGMWRFMSSQLPAIIPNSWRQVVIWKDAGCIAEAVHQYEQLQHSGGRDAAASSA